MEVATPRNERGERIGIGAILETRRPGANMENVGSAVMKALSRATRSMQAPRGVAEREREAFAPRTQEVQTPIAAHRQPDAETTRLAQVDKQQTERALDATRSALKSEVKAQAKAARPHSQDRDEGTTRPAEGKAQEPEPGTTQLILVSRSNGSRTEITVPENYTTEDINRAMQAAGFKGHEFSPSWTPQGLGIRGRDIWQAVKKAWQRANQG